MHLIALLLALCISATATRPPVYLRKNGGRVDIGHVHGELWLVQRGNDYAVGRPGGRPVQFNYAINSKVIRVAKSSLRMSPALGQCLGNDDFLQDNLIKISLALHQVLLNPSIRLPSFYGKPILRLEYDMHPQVPIAPIDVLLMAQMLALNQRQENWSRRSVSMTRGIKKRGTLRIEIAPESAFCILSCI